MSKTCIPALIAMLASIPAQGQHRLELGEFQIREPLGVNWPDEWISTDITIDRNRVAVPARSLRVLPVVGSEGRADLTGQQPVPAQFYRRGEPLAGSEVLEGTVHLKVLCNVHLRKGRTLSITRTHTARARSDRGARRRI